MENKHIKRKNPLLDQCHLEAFECAYKQAFGEHASVAYGQGAQSYSIKMKNSLLEVLETSDNFKRFSETIQKTVKRINTGDALSKDIAMIVLRPIGLAIEGSMHVLIGLVQVMSNIACLSGCHIISVSRGIVASDLSYTSS